MGLDDQFARRPSNAATASSSTDAASLSKTTSSYKSVWKRLIYGPGPSSSQATPPAITGDRRSNLPLIGPELSQTTCYSAGTDIVAFDVSEAKTHVILAGKHIFKTVRIDGKHCTEELDLRKTILEHESAGAPWTSHRTHQRQILDIHDVKWSHGLYSNYVATASVNGKIVLYDLNRAGVEVVRLQEHTRQVHQVAFNPHQGFLLLSGCHSGTVKLWDIRQAQQEAMKIQSRCTINGKSEAVRALQWSPKDGVEFAIGTDQGAVQRWDYRFPKDPKLKIQAHFRNCNSIDWHPDGKHLVSASDDQTIKVWDFSSGDKRQEAIAGLRTPFPVYNVRWRPPCLSSGTGKLDEWQCTHIATSYDRDHSVVHIWDFRRPCVPFRELNYYSQSPTGMHWKDQHLLWTVGREGLFIQSDVHFAPRTVDRRPMSVLAVAPNGTMTLFSKKRVQRPGFQRDFVKANQSSSGSSAKGISSELFFPAKSPVDDSLDDSVVGASGKKRRSRISSGRPSKSLGNTPPSFEETKRVILFDKSISTAKSFRLKQRAIRSMPPMDFHNDQFTYLAQKCKIASIRDALNDDAVVKIRDVCNENASFAEQADIQSVASTWHSIASDMRRWLEAKQNDAKEPTLSATSFKELIYYHSGHSDVQTAAFLLQQLTPLLPLSPPREISSDEASVLNMYAKMLIEQKGISPGAAQQVIVTHMNLFYLGIHPVHAEAILSSYHQQLTARQLHKEAAELRKRCYPTWPTVWGQAVLGTETEQRRDGEQALCPICCAKVSPYSTGGPQQLPGHFETASGTATSRDAEGEDKVGTYSVCLGCGHGGHLACLLVWHKEAEAGCPTAGCLHQCHNGEEEEMEEGGKGREPAGGKKVRWEV